MMRAFATVYGLWMVHCLVVVARDVLRARRRRTIFATRGAA